MSVAAPTFRYEFDHFAALADAASVATVDPLTNIFYYLYPPLGAWLCGHQELRSNDHLQSTLLSESARQGAFRLVEQLRLAANIDREISVYTSDGYSCASFGGGCSISNPIISIPRGFLAESGGSVFGDEPLPPGVTEPGPHWKYSPDETLFFIAREVAHVRANNALLRIAEKVLYLSSLFFIIALPVYWLVGLWLLAGSSLLHILAEQAVNSQMDLTAVDILEALWGDRDRAKAAAISAIEKLIAQNKERREGNLLCRFYISESGNNFLDLTRQPLTLRLEQLRTL